MIKLRNNKQQSTFNKFVETKQFSKEHRLSLLYAKRMKLYKALRRKLKQCSLITTKTEYIKTYLHDVKFIDREIKEIQNER